MFAVLALVRLLDLVTNHRSLATNDRAQSLMTFGAGLSWWFPERAAGFIERENLPGEIFNTYDEGGYLVWRLGPKHRDYVDGRAIPFGPESFRHESELLHTSPDSELWQREANRYNLNTVILPVGRFGSPRGTLKAFCNSSDWRPVYLDEISVVFVRRKPETEDLIKGSQMDCSTAPLPAQPLLHSSEGYFHQWINAASVLASLGRNSEALAATDKARLIVPDSSFVPWLRGNIFHVMELHSDAEREYLTAISLEPGEAPFWFSLATLYKDEGRIPETIHAQRRAIELAPMPQPWELVKLARLYLEVQQPKAALETFDEAVRMAPPDVLATSGARSSGATPSRGSGATSRTTCSCSRTATSRTSPPRGWSRVTTSACLLQSAIWLSVPRVRAYQRAMNPSIPAPR
jgi:tetratricopeptide (TPR) repeat protein